MWGYPETEPETSFDPLVGMLLSACASELEGLSHEIGESQLRVTDRLIQFLSPDTLTGVIPAHSVAYAESVEPVCILQPEHQFYVTKKTKSDQDPANTVKSDFFFSAAGKYKLVNGRVAYMGFSDKLYTITDNRRKELVANGTRRLNASSLWLGLTLDPDVTSLDKLSFCFTFLDSSRVKLFLHNLKKTKWFINGEPISTCSGLMEEFTKKADAEAVLKSRSNISQKINRHVNNYYKDQFVTIDAEVSLTTTAKDSRDIIDAFGKIKDHSNAKIQWIEVRFPEAISASILAEVFCTINAFPVVNKRLHHRSFRLKEYLNIVPLETSDAFLDIKNIEGLDGWQYGIESLKTMAELEPGSLLVRSEGVGRFDNRSAGEFTNHLLELLKDESAAFSSMGRDMLSNDVKKLNQIIFRLEQKLDSVASIKESTTYLMLKARHVNDNVFLEYWSTKGKMANNLRSGSRLNNYKGVDIKEDSAMLLRTSSGGRDRLDMEGRLNAYRKALLSRQRIVTSEDVKALCYSRFEGQMEKVEIQKSFSSALSSKEGLQRTLDVLITPAKDTKLKASDWDYLCEDLLVTLKERSSNILPYRIIANTKVYS